MFLLSTPLWCHKFAYDVVQEYTVHNKTHNECTVIQFPNTNQTQLSIMPASSKLGIIVKNRLVARLKTYQDVSVIIQ